MPTLRNRTHQKNLWFLKAILFINFRITDDDLGAGGPKQKFRANMEAISLLKKLEAENRTATPEEQDILSRYVGWGGLPAAFEEGNGSWASECAELKQTLTEEEYRQARASTLNAFYTPPVVVKAMYEALHKCIEVCLSDPRAAIAMESACYYQGVIESEPDVLVVATERTDRSVINMKFPIERHYFSGTHFQYGMKKIETKFGKYNIYSIERSVYNMVRLKDNSVIEVFNRLQVKTAQYQWVSEYGEMLKEKNIK